MSVINNLWEESSAQANCNLCPADEPFFMPLERTDLVALRLQLPYQYVTANGGGLPIGANVRLRIVDEIGTTTLCDLSTANLGRFLFGYVNDNTNKVAQYQIYSPIPMVVAGGNVLTDPYTHYYVDVTAGNWVSITGTTTGADADFIYGSDPLPAMLVEIKPGRIVIPVRLVTVGFTVNVNGTPVVPTLLYTTATGCNNEAFQCFRFRLTLTFTVSGVTRDFYTKPFRIFRCADSVRVSAQYPSATTDPNGYLHQATWNIASIADPNRLLLRIPADIDREASRVVKSFNSKCFAYRTEVQKRYRLKSDPVPWWFAHEVENIAAGTGFAVDNVEYLNDTQDSVFQNSDIESSSYQNIDLPLQQCKSEKVFVC